MTKRSNSPPSEKSAVNVVVRDEGQLFRLLKVERRGDDIYGFIPGLGQHYSQHASGQTHFRKEVGRGTTVQPPVIVMSGVGEPTSEGIRVASGTHMRDFGRADAVFTVWFAWSTPKEDYPPFRNRSAEHSVQLDRGSFAPATEMIEIGVWTVSPRNKPSFYAPGGPASRPDFRLLFVDEAFDPQTWVYASSC